MIRNQRIIPVLLLDGEDLVKTVEFSSPVYLGDPINALKIFNDKYVDEIIVLDISSSKKHHKIQFDLLHQMASECFMPLCYGGGIDSVATVKKLIETGIERVSLNSAAFLQKGLVNSIAKEFGISTVVVSIDYKEYNAHNCIYVLGGKKQVKTSLIEAAYIMQEEGAGEIIFQNISKDGVMQGYNLELLEAIMQKISIPAIWCSGAGNVEDILAVKEKGASAAAGSFFVFKGRHRAKLINYPFTNQI